MRKELKTLIRALEADGYHVRITKKGHLQVSCEGQVITVFAGTPSDRRSWANSMRPLKRRGFTFQL